MIWWHGALLIVLAVAVGLWAGWAVGRSDTKLGCAPKLDEAYDEGDREGRLDGYERGRHDFQPRADAAAEITRLTEGWDDQPSAWRGQMAHDLAPGELDERPASDTEQFRAIFGSADPLLREVWRCWDARMREEHEWELLKYESGVVAA